MASVNIVTISDILNSWESYLIPTIQREYVWDSKKIKNFFDSVRKGYPVGSVILWEVDDENIPSLPIIGDKIEKKSNIHIIDGNQRVTTLFLALNHWKIKRGGKTIETKPIYYNPYEDKFVENNKGNRYISLSDILREDILEDENAYDKIQMYSPEQRRKINKLQQKIINYNIPVYTISEVRDYEEIADVFVRLNSGGSKVKGFEIFLALFSSKTELSKGVKDKVFEIVDNYSTFDLDIRVPLRLIFSNAGLKLSNLFDSSANPISILIRNGMTNEKLMDITNDSKKAFDVGMDFLKKIGISSSKFLVYQNALVPISKYIYLNRYDSVEDISYNDTRNMLIWLYIVSFRERFGNSIDAKLQKDIKILENEYNNGFPTKLLLRNLSHRKKTNIGISKTELDEENASYKKKFKMMLAIVLNNTNATDWSYSDNDDGKKIVETMESGNLTVHHIFPKELLKKEISRGLEIDDSLINSIGNITLIHKEINSSIKDAPPIEYLTEYEPFLKEHLIPEDRDLWRIEQFNEFVEKRKELIYRELENLGIANYRI